MQVLDRESSILWIRGLRHPIPRLHFPSLISVYHAVLCTTHPLSAAPPELRYYFGVASAGSMHTRRRRSRVIYDYAREHDKPRHGGQKVDTTREGYASRRLVLSWIDRYIDALAPIAPESVDLSSPIALRAASGELMGRPRSVVGARVRLIIGWERKKERNREKDREREGKSVLGFQWFIEF